MKTTIRVSVVDDDPRLRRTLSEVIQFGQGCECVGVFPTGKAALTGLPELSPNVILMDINLPDISGVECVSQLAPQLPHTKIIMLTVYQDTETIFRALAAGAHGYLVKPVLPDKLLESVRDIHHGGVPMSPSIARKIIESFLKPRPAPAPAAPKAHPIKNDPLGAREQQVLELLVAGLSYKEIAQELGIKTPTVGTYVGRIYEKLHVHSRRGIIARYKTRDIEA